MKRFYATCVVLMAGARFATAAIPDTYAPSNSAAATPPPSVATTPPAATPQAQPSSGGGKATAARTIKGGHSASSSQTLAQMQASLDELTKSNHDLLDLLKQQQSVLEDIQYDRRLQSRQIENLEARLEEAMLDRQQLQGKVDTLEAQASRPSVTAPAPPAPNPPPTVGTTQPVTARPQPDNPPSVPVITSVRTPPGDGAAPPPATYLPPEGADNPTGQGQASWHRLFTLKGTDNQQSDVFTVHGKLWRVLWHNQDKAGKLFANTSALFINAFPRDDTIPEKVCSKLGTGSDSMQLQGPGNYYLKVEASGGSWELAVEDFH